MFSTKQKISTTHKPHKLVSKIYFLSIEYFAESYHSMELQTKTLHEWYAMSKIKFKNYKSFFQILILLSGDIAMNPGPSSYPCSKCNTGVGSGAVLCNSCNKWIHSKCEGLSRSQVIALSRTANLNFTCCVCRCRDIQPTPSNITITTVTTTTTTTN